MAANIINYSRLSRILDKTQKNTSRLGAGGASLTTISGQTFFDCIDNFVGSNPEKLE